MWASPDKEGELTKQGIIAQWQLKLFWIGVHSYFNFLGHIIKSWKVRWFVLQKDNLFYFKDRKKVSRQNRF